jgi:hypothetical protein
MFAHSSGPTGLQHVLLLRCFELLRNHYFLLFSLSKARVHYILTRPCQLIDRHMLIVSFFSYILTIPSILSLVNYYYIRYTSSHLGPIKGVRGNYL